MFENYINNLKVGYSPSINSFNNLIYEVFKNNNYSLDIITGITYAITVDDKTIEFNNQGMLDIIRFDIAFKLLNFEVQLTGASV